MTDEAETEANKARAKNLNLQAELQKLMRQIQETRSEEYKLDDALEKALADKAFLDDV